MTKPQVSEMSETSSQPKMIGPGGTQAPPAQTWFERMSEGLMEDAFPMEYVNEGWV